MAIESWRRKSEAGCVGSWPGRILLVGRVVVGFLEQIHQSRVGPKHLITAGGEFARNDGGNLFEQIFHGIEGATRQFHGLDEFGIAITIAGQGEAEERVGSGRSPSARGC
jgi:hypothetical protein